ncbi:NADPH-dependent oxidoreductase [Trichocoleus desertorum AS-A10]|uniref:NADPH-dependent oxidoreductase n=1 Tax=Trichocoleus desertorum TaxID=1481672 RepID=UPI0032976495
MTFTAPAPTTAANLLRDRYGTAFDLSLEAPWNSSLTTLLSHRSVRSYLSKPLPSGTLETLIAAAQSASTSSNLQTWSVVAIEDPERKDRLAQLAGNQAHIRQAPLFLVWLADLARPTHIAAQRGFAHDGLNYLEMFLMSAIDATLAAQNAAVAAESLDLGTVYIGGIRNQPVAVAAELGLPKQVFAVFGLCVGYPDPAKPAAIKPRLPQAAVLHRETYNLEAQDAAIAHYNELMAAFYDQQNMKVEGDWTQHSSDRVASAESLRNRAHLHDILHQLGFELR